MATGLEDAVSKHPMTGSSTPLKQPVQEKMGNVEHYTYRVKSVSAIREDGDRCSCDRQYVKSVNLRGRCGETETSAPTPRTKFYGPSLRAACGGQDSFDQILLTTAL
jgi:hypothetical protein